MADPINMEDEELLSLMLALEEETGVKAATAVAPVVATSTAPVVTPVTEKAPEVVTAPAATALSEDEELLNALSVEPTPVAASQAGLPAALLAGIKAQQAAAVTTAPVVTTEPEVNVDDELAALEAGLADGSVTASAVPEVVIETTGRITEEAAARIAADAVTSSQIDNRIQGTAKMVDAAAQEKRDASVSLQEHIAGLDFFVDPKQFALDTRLSDIDLDKNMMEQNALRAYYGTQTAQAEAQAARTKMKFEIIEAKLYDQHRRLILESGEKVTEKMVENEVKKDPRWAAAKGKLIDAETIYGINKALVESLKDRSSMLVNLSADRRDEFKSKRSTMAITDAHEDQRTRASEAARAAIGQQ